MVEVRMMRTSRAIAALVLVAATYVGSASAQDVRAGDLQIEHPWSRATPAGAKIGAGYLVIANKGATADRLVGGSTAAAGKVEIHEMSMKGNVMTMRRLSGGLTIDPGKSVTFAPGGYHLMFVDLKSPLKQGSKFTATLEFEKAGKVDVTFDVQAVGAKGPMSEHSDSKM
jgi:periplasmic copper chaperone A